MVFSIYKPKAYFVTSSDLVLYNQKMNVFLVIHPVVLKHNDNHRLEVITPFRTYTNNAITLFDYARKKMFS